MKKHHVGLRVDKNAFLDEGDGVVLFPDGLVITDDSEQRNGTKYDIESMDVTDYQGQMTADHVDDLDRLIAGVEGVEKVGNKVILKKINYLVKESALARLAYDLLRNPKVPTNFSIETIGPWPSSDDDTYYRAKLVGLSQVVLGNNRSAAVNAVVRNSIAESKKEGLDTTELEESLKKDISIEQSHKTEDPADPAKGKDNNKVNKEEDMKIVTVKNSQEFDVVVTYKNAAGEDSSVTLAAAQSVDVSEDQQEAIQKQINEATKPVEKEETVDNAAKTERDALLADVKSMFADALKPLNDKIEQVEENALNAQKVEEPQFVVNNGSGRKPEIVVGANGLEKMDWRNRTAEQIEAARNFLVNHDPESMQKLHAINKFHLESLKKEGKVSNAVNMGDFGNFVTSPELLTEIQGCRTEYDALVNAVDWVETMSIQTSWLERDGDIVMSEVEFCDDDANGNRKPISEYSATPRSMSLREVAAVTPVCNAATRFLAVDILADVAQGYRRAYNKNRAQLVIARLEQAVEFNGNSVIFDTNPNVEALVSLLNAWKEIATCTPTGTFLMNTSSYATILAYALRAGTNGPLANLFTTGDQPTLFGRPYIVVPDDLMPSLDSASTVTVTTEGQTITVNHGIFYFDTSNIAGRVSGGLNYTLSTDAAYEENGVVKSAFQRDEVVLRGYFFRNAAVKDRQQVAGVLSPGVS